MTLTITTSGIVSTVVAGPTVEMRCPYCGECVLQISGDIRNVWLRVKCGNRRCRQWVTPRAILS